MRRDASSHSSNALERHESGLVAADGIVVPYRIVRSARRRRTLELRIEADGVRVSVPLRTPRHEVDAFVRSRIDWIRKQRVARPRPAALQFVTGDVLRYLNRPMPLEVVEGTGRRAQVHVDLLGIRVAVPRGAQDQRETVQDALRRWYRERAHEEILARVERWAARAGYAPRRVLIVAPVGDDNFRAASVDRIATSARQVYRLWERESSLEVLHPPGPHDFSDDMRKAAYEWIDESW